MMRYFIDISYNGKNYHGWQIQKNAVTVQSTIQDVISKILGKSIDIVGSGRTDTGVHAKSQVAHFDVNKELWDLSNEVLKKSLKRAKEVGAPAILHTENGTPEVMKDLSNIAEEINFPKSHLVKHYGGIGSIEKNFGITVSLLATSKNIAFASKNKLEHMLETDYLDDPNRPGAVLGPKTVPRKTLKFFPSQIIKKLISSPVRNSSTSIFFALPNFPPNISFAAVIPSSIFLHI